MPYNPQGEAGGVFAPPHIAGDQQAQQATEAWYANKFPLRPDQIDDLRQPVEGADAGDGTGNSIAFGTKQGTVPQSALLTLAQGNPTGNAGGGFNQQRNAIASQMMANGQGGSTGDGTLVGGSGMVPTNGVTGPMAGGGPGAQGQQIGERWDPQEQLRRMREMQFAMGSGAGW